MLNEEKALPLLEYAYKRGINTWDTVGFSSLFGFHLPHFLSLYLFSLFFLLDRSFNKSPRRFQADIYSHGRSEEIIGKALKNYNIPRSNVVLLTKCYFGVEEGPGNSMPRVAAVSSNDGEWVNKVGLSRKHILDAVDGSVRRLGTYIDVLQIHRLDRDVPREEIMKALNDVVESGQVRYIGASSVSLLFFGYFYDMICFDVV